MKFAPLLGARLAAESGGWLAETSTVRPDGLSAGASRPTTGRCAASPQPRARRVPRRARHGRRAGDRRQARARASTAPSGSRSAQDADVKLVDTLSLPNTEVVTPEGDAGARARRAQREPGRGLRRGRLLGRPLSSDTYFGYLWGLQNTGQSVNGQVGVADADIDAPEAWTRTQRRRRDGRGDRHRRRDHPPGPRGPVHRQPGRAGQRPRDQRRRRRPQRLRRRLAAAGTSSTTTTPSRPRAHTHGTHVSGTIAALADNNVGVAGVAPRPRSSRSRSSARPTPRRRVHASRRPSTTRAALGVPVVNASLGGPGNAHDRHRRDHRPPEHALRRRRRQRRRRRLDHLPVQRATPPTSSASARPTTSDQRRVLLELQRDLRRPVRARLRHRSRPSRLRLRLHGRHVDGHAARRGRRRAAAPAQARARRPPSSRPR